MKSAPHTAGAQTKKAGSGAKPSVVSGGTTVSVPAKPRRSPHH